MFVAVLDFWRWNKLLRCQSPKQSERYRVNDGRVGNPWVNWVDELCPARGEERRFRAQGDFKHGRDASGQGLPQAMCRQSPDAFF
jgi:hypothetical protein